MPKVSKEFRQAIEELPLADLQKLVIELARKNKEAYYYINLKHISTDESEQELFEEYRDKVVEETWGVHNRGNVQKNLAAAIGRAVKHINYFEKVTKNNKLVADLLLELLEEVFKEFSIELGTCFTAFDSKLATTTNRLYNLVTKKLHPDYMVEYREPMNKFLKILHQSCKHLDYVYGMPTAMPE
jgi:hypothetical protein